MHDRLINIEAWRVRKEMPDYWGPGGACRTIKNLWAMVERFRDTRNDRRSMDFNLIVVADVFAQGALLTKQVALDGITTSDGKVALLSLRSMCSTDGGFRLELRNS